ncbi:MAG: transaldolase family protein [Candidatus Methanomethylicaceae archaeon]|jgi:transaldolase
MTEIFLDTANTDEIRAVLPWGIASGVTTNQKIFFTSCKGVNFKQRVKEILSLVDGPLSVELTTSSGSDEDLINEAKEYASWGNNIVVKVPMWADGRGLRIINQLQRLGIKTNATCLMTVNQVLLASKAGATYVSIFFNRVKDSGADPVQVIKESRQIIDISGLKSKIIVGSIRKPEDLSQAAVAGAHILTIPHKILMQMPYHAKTEETIKEFDEAWAEFQKSQGCSD